MGDAGGGPDTIFDKVSPQKKDRALPWLRWMRRRMRWSLMVVFVGLVIPFVGFFLELLFLAPHMHPSLSDIMIGLGVFVAGLGVVGLSVFGGIWFFIVFFCYSQYSLRSLVFTVLIFGTSVSMLASDRWVLQAAGAILLAVLALVIVARIGANEPLMGHELKELLGKRGSDEKVLDP